MVNDRCNICKGTSARSRSRWWQSGDGANKRGLNTKMHMAVNAAGKPVRFIFTSGTVADCSQAKNLIKDTGAKYLLADRGYDTNEIRPVR
ncbi:MAG: transposase [Synergistaceae bacterium]|nr:transposase [Synergistaceae bacterium]